LIIIGLDYDDTYTEDPELWRQFTLAAQDRGHIVVFSTARNDDDPLEESLPDVDVVYSNGEKKMKAFQDQGFPVPTIWIDDRPELIL
jgi:hypothetical protein